MALSALAGMAGCAKEKSSDSAASTASATAAPTTAPAPAVSATATTAAAGAGSLPENIPVAADFEEEAEKSITKANYRAELDSLEAEMK